jgi:hypothetical protein
MGEANGRRKRKSLLAKIQGATRSSWWASSKAFESEQIRIDRFCDAMAVALLALQGDREISLVIVSLRSDEAAERVAALQAAEPDFVALLAGYASPKEAR